MPKRIMTAALLTALCALALTVPGALAESNRLARDAFSAEIMEGLHEALGETLEVREVFGLAASEESLVGDGYSMTAQFGTHYVAGQPVAVVLVTVHGEEKAEFLLQAEVIEDFKVRVWFPLDVLEQMIGADECFAAIINAA